MTGAARSRLRWAGQAGSASAPAPGLSIGARNIGPLLWLSGLLYITYNLWPAFGINGLELWMVAAAHTAGAFLMIAFLIAHLYLALTTADVPFGNLKAMIRGYEEQSEA